MSNIADSQAASGFISAEESESTEEDEVDGVERVAKTALQFLQRKKKEVGLVTAGAVGGACVNHKLTKKRYYVKAPKGFMNVKKT